MFRVVVKYFRMVQTLISQHFLGTQKGYLLERNNVKKISDRQQTGQMQHCQSI